MLEVNCTLNAKKVNFSLKEITGGINFLSHFENGIDMLCLYIPGRTEHSVFAEHKTCSDAKCII